MKRVINILLLFSMTTGLLVLPSCEVDPVVDPNNPSLGSVLNNASKAELQVLVTGLEARNRNYYGNATQLFGVFGREVWAYFGSDPRFTSHWLGTGITETYNSFFAAGGTYNTPFQAVKQANILLEAANNSTQLTAEEAAGYTGLAKTIMAFQMMWPWLQQWENGIRTDVSDPLNPGPFRSRIEALRDIREILNDGWEDLQRAGSSFSFSLTGGFAGYDTPAGMIQVNRAIAARLALYAEDWQGALTALDQSFMDRNVDAVTSDKMWEGPQLVFGEAPDINNPLFYEYDRATATILLCHPAWVEDAIPGDARLNKVIERIDNPVGNPGIRNADGEQILGIYQDNRWASNISPIPFIRNEELILIYAEAQANLQNAGLAVDAIDIVRNTWGIGDYTGATDLDSLIEEILFQRRYSLWAEGGHRWVDLRRTGRLTNEYIDLRDQGTIFTQVARPLDEINWDER